MLADHRAHTTLPASDLQRAKAFYSDKLGLEPVKEESGGMTFEVGGGNRFVVYPSGGSASGSHTQLGFTVDDIDLEVKELKARGVEFIEYDLPNLKTIDGIATMGPIRHAWFKDSEGNLLSMVQFSP